jgi:hypothetical protein
MFIMPVLRRSWKLRPPSLPAPEVERIFQQRQFTIDGRSARPESLFFSGFSATA